MNVIYAVILIFSLLLLTSYLIFEYCIDINISINISSNISDVGINISL